MFLESHPAVHALRVALCLAQLLQRVDALAVEQPEVAHVLQNLHASSLLQQFVVEQSELLACPALLAACDALGIHVFVALVP